MKKHLLMQIFMFVMVCVPMTMLSVVFDVAAQEDVQKELIPMDLDATEWDVAMVYVSENGKKETSEDKLLFNEKKFVSQAYEKKGYASTNYSLMAQPDGTTQFGTMQVKGKETVFWKGTVRDEMIDGSVHVQFSNGDHKTTYFNGKLTKGALVLLGQKKPEPTPPAPAPAVEAGTSNGSQNATTPEVATGADSSQPAAVEVK